MAGPPTGEPDLDALRRRLLPAEPPPAAASGGIPAAVLVPIVASPEGSYLVFTVRSSALGAHAGEVSFPGGRVEPGETTRDAALREAKEELGIVPGSVDLLGTLPSAGTRVSGFHITPWVGALALAGGSPPLLVPDPGEVAEVLRIPIHALRAPGVRRVQRFILGPAVIHSPAFDVGQVTIWGATARILDKLLPLLVA
ncbi:MAG TPA: CoA pyrophosphatase [Actinomycetota bacterium]|nr:CoA pyrophosphatase [Actinomycetota bacterium]